MQEHDFIKIIKNITNSTYLGDDCAYLKDLEIVVTQDNFIENVHFKKDWSTPFQIGYKAAVVNISDILASGAIPAYLTVGLSLPKVEDSFIKELYEGIIAGSYGAEIIGGDITGSEKIMISITAIGKTTNRRISSRSFARPGYIVVTTGKYGVSSKGLCHLFEGKKGTPEIKAHLEPILNPNFSKLISSNLKDDYAMMDTSDGLADALFQIAKSSNVTIAVKEVDGIYCAEDYNLVAVIPEDSNIPLSGIDIIGRVFPYDGFYLKIGDKNYNNYDELNLFNHFK